MQWGGDERRCSAEREMRARAAKRASEARLEADLLRSQLAEALSFQLSERLEAGRLREELAAVLPVQRAERLEADRLRVQLANAISVQRALRAEPRWRSKFYSVAYYLAGSVDRAETAPFCATLTATTCRNFRANCASCFRELWLSPFPWTAQKRLIARTFPDFQRAWHFRYNAVIGPVCIGRGAL